MTRLLQRWEALGLGESRAARLARLLVYAVLLFIAFECITIDFRWPEQAVLGIITIVITFLIHKGGEGELITLALMFASVSATARYCWWRCATVIEAVVDPGVHIGPLNLFFMLLLLAAELYAFVILFLGYIQTVRPLRRPPVPLPRSLDEWPDVDLLIPTYNEPLSIVRSTVFASMNIDYPPDKLHIYVCDDGRREEFRRFCEETGIGYVIRNNNTHAKAGNINQALAKMTSPYVAIFDCDHVPTRSFMQMTVGWFFRDKKLGMLQTPHFFYSPDPFERNLSQFKIIPNEGELFYGVLQDGNDLWNATFFCGSCAVLRRTALDEVGGIAVETVTEDAHTSLRMQSKGWNTAYINIPQAAGLATESLSGHVGQRIRWARGMVQILRTNNPLTTPGLKWPQRLCYFNAMIHFLYAVPRLIFLTAPLVYMLLGCINIPGHWIAILAYSMPHLFLANVVNFRIQGKHRYSFWNEVYETVLAPYILMPTLLALINPKLGKFNVTAKGGIVSQSYFDSRIARPYVALIMLNFIALAVAPIRLIYWNANHPGTIVMNVVWILFNLIIIGTANATAIESKQLRNNVRIDLRMPIELRLPDGRSIFGETLDLSLSGTALTLEEPFPAGVGTSLRIVYPLRGGEADFPAIVVRSAGLSMRLKYEELSIKEEEMLTLVLYSRADTWLSRSEQREMDRPLHSFARLLKLSFRGIGYAFTMFLPKRKSEDAPLGARAAASVLLICGLTLFGLATQARAATGAHPATVPAPAGGGGGSFHSTYALKDIGSPDAIHFRGTEASATLPFSLPLGQVVESAKLNLHYSFSTGLLTQLSHLNVLLNGTMIATLPAPERTGNPQDELTTSLALPAELLARNNSLSFQFIGHYTEGCEDPSSSVLWSRIEPSTSIELTGSSLAMTDDLKQLPLPFYDGQVNGTSASIPFVFATPPSPRAMQAAGAVASWFGVTAKSRALKFPVSIGGDLPHGNVVLFAESSTDLPPALHLESGGAAVAVRSNPNDPYGKVLIFLGDDGDQLLSAARSIALGNNLLQGPTAHISDFQLPHARRADDAPLWASTEQVTPIWNYSSESALQSDGSGPLRVYLRIPPDLYYGDRTTLPLHMDYRYNAVPLSNSSTLRISANGGLVNEMPLPHQSNPKQELESTLAVPLIDMRPFTNTFLFNFYFQIAKKGNCQDTPPINLQGAILRSSYLDISGLDHWAAMPNLELFSNAGFPFTRFADLGQTTVVLPTAPTVQELGVYLSMLAYFGEQTGYPALRVDVGDASKLGGNADYLILGSPADQPAFEKLGEDLPISINSDGVSIRNTSGFFRALQHTWWQIAELRPDWWWKLRHAPDRDGLTTSMGQFPDALIQGLESPWSAGRSIVTITLRNGDSAGAFMDAFLKASASSDISDSVSVLHGADFTSYRLDDRVYHVGQLPWYGQVRYWLKAFPWLIVVFTFLLGLLVVPWARARLDQRSKARLEAHQ